MLVYVLQDDLEQAQAVYDAALDLFPEGNPGHPYAQLATAFWEEYAASADVAAACAQAVEYASAHADEILTPLGSAFYGYSNRDYAAQDVCPFGE